MTEPGHSLTERLAQHLLRPIGPDMRERARLHLLDWLGCVAGALTAPVAEAVRRAELPPCHLGSWLGNALEMDDVHRQAVLHPGPVVWSAALEAALDEGAGTDAMLDGAVRGYEAMIAVGATFDAWHYAHYHPTATAGPFGSAAAGGCVYGLSADDLVNALGNAGSTTGGLWRTRHEPVMTKQLHAAYARNNGLFAAHMAKAGVTGPRFILEGEQGLYAATCRAPKPMVLGEGWRMAEVSFKPWGACRHAHPAIDAALRLRERGALGGQVLVETYRDALTFCDRAEPATVLEAKFSLQHAVAVVAERGVPALADFEPDAIAALAPARTRVRVAEAPEITARYPAHFGARITAAGGTVEVVDTLGDPERPLGREGVIAKARALMDWGGVAGDADEAVAACLDRDDPGAIAALLERWS